MSLDLLYGNNVVNAIGWTLAHSIWQIGLISATLFILLRSVLRTSANARYALSVTALALSVILPSITFLQVREQLRSETGQAAAKRIIDRGNAEKMSESAAATAVDDTHTSVGRDRASYRLLSLSTASDLVRQTVPTLFPFVVTIWIAGIAFFSFRLFGGLWKLHDYKSVGSSNADDKWNERLTELSDLLGVRRKVSLLRSNVLATPIAVGLIKPIIIVPTSVFLHMDPRQLESIIAHELIHIRRYDCLVNVFQSVAEVLFFYHPAVWWISAEIRREREFAADAAVLVSAGDHLVYAAALANLEELRQTANGTAPSIAMAANGGNLMQRIKRILDKKTEISRANSAWSAGIAISTISILLLALFSFSPRSIVNGQKRDSGGRKLAIGFVSIPPIDRSDNPPKDSFATAQLLMNVLRSHGVPATGFVTGSSVSDGDKIFPVRAEIVKMWRDQGFEIGVGGFKHLSFFDTAYDDYTANTEKNETVVKKILGNETSMRYFSYPYLNTGKTTTEHDRFESWLAARGISSVKYTVDNQEWMYSYAYDMARNDNDINTMREIRASFISYMTKMFDHYEAYSQDMFGRDIAQTMVLTPSRLVADTGNDLFGMLEKRGYKFVSMSEAQGDPAYQTPEDFTGKAGISWFERWQMKQGKPLLDEPDPDANILKTWEAKKPGNVK